MTMTETHITLIDALKRSFDAAIRGPEGVAEPAALLWTDPEKEWLPLIPALNSAFPQLYILGEYDPAKRTGPIIWLKCVVDRTLPEVSPPADLIPIIYLPGVNRQLLRAPGDCPIDLQPVIELQYRGAVWHQRNGRDWTVEAFLSSDDGIGLDISKDSRTKEAMLRALPLLAMEPVSSLKGKRLEAEDFDRLSFDDPIRDLLTWMNDPKNFQELCEPAKWKTFREVCKREFNTDPEEGTIAAGEVLLHGGGRWDDVWRRFCDSPQLYRGVAAILRNARPKDLYIDESKIPSKNNEYEQNLGKALSELLTLPSHQACERIVQLNAEHEKRQSWVWAKLGESPLCLIMGNLAKLAVLAKSPLGGSSASQMVSDYITSGWFCDRAVVDIVSQLKPPIDANLIKSVVQLIYEPWLDQTTRHFQKLVMSGPLEVNQVDADKETCVIFIDGLRYDLGMILVEKLRAKNLNVSVSHRISPLPTVTATAKPLAAPLRGVCEGTSEADDFYPVIRETNELATTVKFRNALENNGVCLLKEEEVSYGKGGEKGGWSEFGEIDALGHKLGTRLVQHIEGELDAIVERVLSLLEGGWLRVRITTDHGWILVPGGLKKIELPHYLVATKWSRCAVVKGESSPAVPIFPWFWNKDVRIACPPGAGSFIAGNEYAHGGVSLQECVIPEISVDRGEQAPHAKITEIKWIRLLCRISAETNIRGAKVDLRLNWKQPNTSIAASLKDVVAGSATLAVADDKYDGHAVSVVLLDDAGRVLDYQPTTIGVNL